jgi:tryptophan synthase alpha chain
LNKFAVKTQYRHPIAQCFAQLKTEGRKVLIPYFTAGYPSQESSFEAAAMAFDAGADLIELGVPFSDPIADGPTIQHSSQRALNLGITPSEIFRLVERLKSRYDRPVILMGYLNPIIAPGADRFLHDCRNSGVDGLIIPDLPLEEARDLRGKSEERGISLVLLVAPTTTPERMRQIEKLSGDFVYAVSIAGTTGAKGTFGPKTIRYFKKLKSTFRKPYVIGFGISNAAMARTAARYADGVVIGSALVDCFRRHKGKRQGLAEARRLLAGIRRAI